MDSKDVYVGSEIMYTGYTYDDVISSFVEDQFLGVCAEVVEIEDTDIGDAGQIVTIKWFNDSTDYRLWYKRHLILEFEYVWSSL